MCGASAARPEAARRAEDRARAPYQPGHGALRASDLGMKGFTVVGGGVNCLCGNLRGKGDLMRLTGVPAFCRPILVAALCLVGLFSLPAQAVVISIGGNNYDVVIVSSTSYLSVRDDVMSAPWWNDQALATEAATNFGAATGGAFGPGITFAQFVYSDTGGGVADEHSRMALRTNLDLTGPITIPNILTYSGSVFAYVPTPAAVPEIDGNALAKALFILFTLYVWILVRRNRRIA